MEENERVFADANYFVALFNASDGLHADALKIGAKIDAAGTRLVTSNFIFLEAVTVLAYRKGKEAACEAGKYLLCGDIEIIHIDETLQRMSWDMFQEISGKNVSFVDASIVAILRAESIRRLLTFDLKDFTKLARQYHFDFYEA